MAILYYDEKKLFQLNTENTTYVIGLSRKATSDMFTTDPSARRAGSVSAPHG